MSNNETFIDEVTEEVRRDRLFKLMRRYGWIAILAVVLLVGGAAWNEWSKARKAADAQALGDAILSALETDDTAARRAALGDIAATGDARAPVALMAAAEAQADGDRASAAGMLETLAADATLPRLYRDLATYKLVLLMGPEMAPDLRREKLEGLATPGAPFRLLAEEQIALIEAETGDTEAAIARLAALLEDNDATAGLRNRVAQLIVAMGGEPGAS